MRRWPGGAVCSSRAAMLTVKPRMVPSSSTPPPSSTWPVWMPSRMSKPAKPNRRCTRPACSRALASSARPACTARSASSSRASGVPKAARMLSPAYCSTEPPCCRTTCVKARKAPSITSCTSSGSSWLVIAVEPTTSRKSTLTCRRCGRAPAAVTGAGFTIAAAGGPRRAKHRRRRRAVPVPPHLRWPRPCPVSSGTSRRWGPVRSASRWLVPRSCRPVVLLTPCHASARLRRRPKAATVPRACPRVQPGADLRWPRAKREWQAEQQGPMTQADGRLARQAVLSWSTPDARCRPQRADRRLLRSAQSGVHTSSA